MIRRVAEFVEAVASDLAKWQASVGRVRPWFRGESGSGPPLCPKIADYSKDQENYLLQSFRRKAGGIANTPPRDQTDMWLFLAQHYRVPTRLLDWTEGALLGLYFAVNRGAPNPRVYMLNPHRLNLLSGAQETNTLNFPLTWINGGYENIALAWEERAATRGFFLPIAVPATYQDHRMIAQRSCFTVHGKGLEPLADLLRSRGVDLVDLLIAYHIDTDSTGWLTEELAVLGVTGATIFPDLDHLAHDLSRELGHP